MGGSDGGGLGACPPVVEYSRELEAQAAEGLALLPKGSAVAETLADYVVIREQASYAGKWVTGFEKAAYRGG